MIIALIITVVGLAASGPICLFLAVRYLRARDEREQTERRELYQRIQAPETAVAQAVDDSPVGALHVEFDNDEDFLAAKAGR